MLKKIIDQDVVKSPKNDAEWLDIKRIAQVELTSEDPEFPIEGAFEEGGKGWRAAKPGKQLIRLIFNEPQKIRHIQLIFEETQQERTQEFVLKWLPKNETNYQEIVRQQYNFSPSSATTEIESFSVNLEGVTSIELSIIPDINQGDIHASLASLRLT